MPLVWGYWPVSKAARLGEQVGLAQKAFRKRTPWVARFWRWGVWMGWPVRIHPVEPRRRLTVFFEA